MKRARRHGAAILIAATVTGAAMAAALPGRALALNPVVHTKPQRPIRTLITGGLVFLDSWKPLTPQLGGLFQIAFLPTTVTPGEGGSEVIEAPHLYLHASMAGGYRFAQSDPQLYGFGELGPLRRTGGEGPDWLSWMTAVGLCGGVAWPQRQAGPILRVEIMDNVGVHGGPLFGWDGRGTGAVFGVDYMRDIFKDLGLTK